MGRVFQPLLIISTLCLSWLAMMAVHEGGHVLHAWLTGGSVARVVLPPLDFSRTDLRVNPRPQAVAWGGPLWGCVLPLLAWLVARKAAPGYAYLARFFAGFCLIANGVYIAGGAVTHDGDAADLLRHGAAWWQLIGFGTAAVIAGVSLRSGLGCHFGIGSQRRPIDRKAAVAITVALVVVVVAELLWCA
jgi:hypothetical protein